MAQGAADEDIPRLCREQGIAAIATANVKDFGAKVALYQALLAEGVSVVVLRPSRQQTLTPENQLAILSAHSRTIGRRLQAAQGSILLRVTLGGVVPRTLAELTDEIESGQRLP